MLLDLYSNDDLEGIMKMSCIVKFLGILYLFSVFVVFMHFFRVFSVCLVRVMGYNISEVRASIIILSTVQSIKGNSYTELSILHQLPIDYI